MNHSPRQMLLRILTGKHAGAELTLRQGQYSIGAQGGCDIVISDCKLEISTLTIDDDMQTAIEMHSSAPDTKQICTAGEPVRLGEVVITFFDPDNSAARPTDLNILQTLLAPPKHVAVRKFGASRWVAGLSACSVLIICLIVLQSPRSTAATRATDTGETAISQVKKILADPRFANVRVSGNAKNVIVSGLVPTREEKESLATQLRSIQSNAIRHQYASETEVTAAITDAIAVPGIRVTHSGGGRFAVTGDVPDVIRTKPEIKRLKLDMSAVISEITFAEKRVEIESDSIESGPNIAGYQFRIAPDGAKYFMSK